MFCFYFTIVAVRTAQEAVAALKDVLPLPTQLIVDPEHVDGESGKSTDASSLQVRLPAEDLKPLYHFSLDCKACKAQLVAAQADLKDDWSGDGRGGGEAFAVNSR